MKAAHLKNLRPGHTGKKIVKVSCQRNFDDFARNFDDFARNFDDLTRNFDDFARKFERHVLYVYCTVLVLYCVRYVYAPVHIRLRHVIGGGNFWKFHKSAGSFTRKFDE